jgi:hypothetical protein
MKTLMKSKSIRKSIAFFSILLLTGSLSLNSQTTRSIFGDETKTGVIWGIDLNTSTVQDDVATQLGGYTGVVFNHSLLVALNISMNLTHPTINYGYYGLMVQYVYRPEQIVHFSGQVTLGIGSVKDYESEKSSVWDNFGNISGNSFYIVRPAINCEINLCTKTHLVFGMGYEFIHGVHENNEGTAESMVTDQDLSGLSFTAGVKFGLY